MPFSSKYRHVFGDVPKAEFRFLDIKAPYTSGEGSYCKANSKFLAVSKSSGGGPVYVHPLAKPGRVGGNMKTINVHKGKCLDFDFHPFIPNIIATVSEDTTCAITKFPIEGLSENISKPTVHLKDKHMKKCHLMKWHPTANNIISTSAWDRTIKLWNIETEDCVASYDDLDEQTFCLEWNRDGSLLAASTKSKSLLMIDPRDASTAVTTPDIVGGKKSSKVFWVPTYGWIGVCGFSKNAKRVLKIFDLKKMDTPLYNTTIDQQASVNMPYYDEDTHMLYTAGKGDGSIIYYELVNDKKIIYQLGSYRDTEPQKGGGWVPKHGMDTKKCEVARFMKLTRNSVTPISFVVPRKTGATIHQEDIYPNTIAPLPAMTADEYLGGDCKEPVMMSMNPAERDEEKGGAVTEFVKKKPYHELAKENQELQAKIKELEERLAELNKGE